MLCLYPSFFCLRCRGLVTLGPALLTGRLFTVLELPCDAVAANNYKIEIRNHIWALIESLGLTRGGWTLALVIAATRRVWAAGARTHATEIFYIKEVMLHEENISWHIFILTLFVQWRNWLIIVWMTLRLDQNKQDFTPLIFSNRSFQCLRRVVRRPMVHYYWPSWYSLASHWSIGIILVSYWLLAA